MEKINFPTEIWVGNDALCELEQIKNKRVFIVADPFLVHSGVIDQVLQNLAKNDCYVFSDIVPDPPIDKVISGIQVMDEFHAEVIIAVGGGSAIDAAKAMNFFGKRTLQTEIEQFIAIPTTSGTGSEVTNFSVITIPEKEIKVPLVKNELQPDIALLDTTLVMSVPPKITADTGMDVLTHVIEAYVSSQSNVVADALCEKTVRLVFDYLERAYIDGSDQEAREKMHLASCLAGMAFNLTSLGLNHGIAHAAGALLHVPHGRINAILLPSVIEFNGSLESFDITENETAKRYMMLANCVDSATSTKNPRIGIQRLVRNIKQLRKKLDMPETLTEHGISKNEIEKNKYAICSGALSDGCTNTNPRKATISDIEKIINEIA
ncbi:1-propanol dehydrogenase PduQ [Enterococcus mediterraneensis]|uniref:1-propanol dehydrogenase PduQ n=1 Tax=Enterococcus mediterraneensis TaxID=2364791 RepID=UPI000F053BF6|nr:1-propanol dehydrogenase PduQ [Enterococcus mediterraneensis]